MPAIRRVNFQAMVWIQDDISRPVLPSPVGNGWILEDGQLSPVMCELPCAPDCILKLIKCSCTKSRCTASYKCRGSSLPCTEICGCTGDDALCDNILACQDGDDEFSDIDETNEDD